MFSTFTGNSRRPRNVNLSGQAGNPFTNTTWSPSTPSTASKTVTNAQADREKRHADRQRLKAAAKIQRTWRGHKVRKDVAELRRGAFDSLYQAGDVPSVPDRCALAFDLLATFFNAQRDDDMQRLLLFVREGNKVDVSQLARPNSYPSRRTRFVHIMVDALDKVTSAWCGCDSMALDPVPESNAPSNAMDESFEFLQLLVRIIVDSPVLLSTSAGKFYDSIARICQSPQVEQAHIPLVVEALSAPLKAAVPEDFRDDFYKAFAFRFLPCAHTHIFENRIELFSASIDPEQLVVTLLNGYSTLAQTASPDELLWLLAHCVALSNTTLNPKHKTIYLEALQAQLSALSSEVIARLDERNMAETMSDADLVDSSIQPVDAYISKQLYSLVSHESISTLLHDLFERLTSASDHKLRETSLLAGYTFTLLLSFPGRADDIRMRLFLEAIPTAEGDIPTTQILWRTMRNSSLFQKLATESEPPIETLRNYARGVFDPFNSTTEEQEWRVVLMFLELYTFVLRLSDDEDFFSGIQPNFMGNTRPTSRIRACSLSLEDLKVLTNFLKNTAFALHYNAHDIAQARPNTESFARRRPGSRSMTGTTTSLVPKVANGQNMWSSQIHGKLDLGNLKEVVTTAMKMLYERDSRKQFLPPGQWLMTEKLDREDFITAVIAEDERQSQEDANESDDEQEDEPEANSMGLFGARGSNTRVSHSIRIERMRLQQKRALRERRLAELGPKLEILKHMPFIVPFDTRVKIFRQFISLDRGRRSGSFPADPFGLPSFARHHAHIRRGELFEDAFQNFYKIGAGLKDSIHISFVDKFNTLEAGIDGGGVTKEFLTSVTTEAFGTSDDDLGMFTHSDNGLLYPNPIIVDHIRDSLSEKGFTDQDPEWVAAITDKMKRFEFLGRIVGKCMYEGILVDLAFAGFFLLQWPSAGSKVGNTYKGSINDLKDMDENLYKGLLQLKNYDGDVSELGFDFTIADKVSGPGQPVKTVTRNLLPNGDKIPVTNDNRLLYISYVARHRLVVQPALQTAAFLRGLRTIIAPSWLSMFNQSELQRLVGGDSSEIDINDLRRNTVYGGLYVIGDDHQEHDTIKIFWKVMEGFTDAQRRDVLKYVSSTPRAPLLGFSQLNPKFSIRDAGSDEERLPSTSTCVNLLKLPLYRTEATLREKLLYAITSGAGFDLS